MQAVKIDQSIRQVQPSEIERWAQIAALGRAIADRFQPEKIVLFGSYAYGTPHTNSDIDLLIVMPFAGSPFRQTAAILKHIVNQVGVFPLDLVVRTSEQVNERLQIGDRFMQEILERGKILYEANHA